MPQGVRMAKALCVRRADTCLRAWPWKPAQLSNEWDLATALFQQIQLRNCNLVFPYTHRLETWKVLAWKEGVQHLLGNLSVAKPGRSRSAASPPPTPGPRWPEQVGAASVPLLDKAVTPAGAGEGSPSQGTGLQESDLCWRPHRYGCQDTANHGVARDTAPPTAAPCRSKEKLGAAKKVWAQMLWNQLGQSGATEQRQGLRLVLYGWPWESWQ